MKKILPILILILGSQSLHALKEVAVIGDEGHVQTAKFYPGNVTGIYVHETAYSRTGTSSSMDVSVFMEAADGSNHEKVMPSPPLGRYREMYEYSDGSSRGSLSMIQGGLVTGFSIDELIRIARDISLTKTNMGCTAYTMGSNYATVDDATTSWGNWGTPQDYNYYVWNGPEAASAALSGVTAPSEDMLTPWYSINPKGRVAIKTMSSPDERLIYDKTVKAYQDAYLLWKASAKSWITADTAYKKNGADKASHAEGVIRAQEAWDAYHRAKADYDRDMKHWRDEEKMGGDPGPRPTEPTPPPPPDPNPPDIIRPIFSDHNGFKGKSAVRYHYTARVQYVQNPPVVAGLPTIPGFYEPVPLTEPPPGTPVDPVDPTNPPGLPTRVDLVGGTIVSCFDVDSPLKTIGYFPSGSATQGTWMGSGINIGNSTIGGDTAINSVIQKIPSYANTKNSPPSDCPFDTGMGVSYRN